ncbi:hypothetical protein [Bacilliculturomica massiliensis]|uniref:hypothetical protein n=1 Tax=Bacilliculturomica massiliensis TaxID=1917867 RepID=UPI001031B1D8|nr:hypothetical protein [Bacilliculturomica massiliensis]
MNKSKTGVFYWKITAGLLAILLAAAGGLMLSDHLTEKLAHTAPDYSRRALGPVLEKGAVQAAVNRMEAETAQARETWTGPDCGEKETERDKEEKLETSYVFSERDYDFLYHQTGLGRQAVDQVLSGPDGPAKLKNLQDTFFEEPRYICVRDNAVCCREETVDEKGSVVLTTDLTGVQDGDILITKSSHVFGWRNGHAALVIDAEDRETLEAIVIGKDTGIRRFRKWEKYPNILVMRLAGAGREERAQVAEWAEQNLLGVPYRLTAGFFGEKQRVLDSSGRSAAAACTGTQCAHLIWRAYAQFGYDLDPDGGWVVTPKQLANSPLLEVVQVFGMDPDDPWP